MKIKPHGAWYLLPVGLIFISTIIAIVFFYFSIIEPYTSLEDIEENEWYEASYVAGDFISLYFADDTVTSFSAYEFELDYYVDFETTNNNTYTYRIDVERLSGLGGNGCDLFVFEFEEYMLDDYMNFVDIDITNDAEYRFRLVPYFSSPTADLGVQYITIEETVKTMIIAIVSLVIGYPIAIISFIVIIVRRSGSKKNNNNTPHNRHIDPAFMKKQQIKDKSKIENHFDY